MPLSAASLGVTMGWTFAKTNAPFADVKTGPDSVSFSLSGLDITNYSQAMPKRYTIAASGTQDIDVSSFTNPIAEATGFTKILALLLLPTGTDAIARLKPGTSNGLVWFFGGTTPHIDIPEGSLFLYSLKPTSTGQTVDSTHKILTVDNPGTGSLTLTVVAYGKP